MQSKGQSGFSFIEVMIVTSILAVVMAGVMHLTVNLMRSTSIGEARSSRVALGEAIRIQLSQKAICLNSFQKLPGSWTTPTPQAIAINLNSTATVRSTDTSQLIEADRELKTFNSLVVGVFNVTDLKMIGSTSTKSFYAGGVELSVKSRKLSSTAIEDRFQMTAHRIATVVFQTPQSVGAPLSCYATNPELDLQMVVETMCSIQGGTVTNGVCTIPNKSGGDCKPTASFAPIKPWDKCSVPLSKPVNKQDVPAAERGNYDWNCRSFVGGHEFWFPEDWAVGPGEQRTGDCKATAKNVSQADLKAGNIPHSAQCGRADADGSTAGATCVDGVWVNLNGSTPGNPDPGGLGG